MKTTPAGKGEDRLRDRSTCFDHRVPRCFEFVGIEHHQRTSSRDRLFAQSEAALLAVRAHNARIARPIVRELPTEGHPVEAFGARHITDGELDIVDAVLGDILGGFFTHGAQCTRRL